MAACRADSARPAEGGARRDPLTAGFEAPCVRRYRIWVAGALATRPRTESDDRGGAEQLSRLVLWRLPATHALSQDADQIARIGWPGRRARPS